MREYEPDCAEAFNSNISSARRRLAEAYGKRDQIETSLYDRTNFSMYIGCIAACMKAMTSQEVAATNYQTNCKST